MADFLGKRHRKPVEKYECNAVGRRMPYFTNLVPRSANFASWYEGSRNLETVRLNSVKLMVYGRPPPR
jgi:hypothetical protein